MRVLAIIATFIMAGCAVETPVIDGPLPPLTKQFKCLPKDAAFLAAHRGTAKGTSHPENSMSGLKALIKRGYLFAEIDIAGLKDGTHILFHDGVWDDKTTGKGAVAATTWGQAGTYLLKDTRGDLSSETLARLESYLKAAKGKIYLEIDFKSSAKYDRVINLIRENAMSDQVILISYNSRQANALARLAPEMLISVSVEQSTDIAEFESVGVRLENITAWLGNALMDDILTSKLDAMDIPVLGMMGYEKFKEKAVPAHLLVTDYAFEHQPVLGLTSKSRTAYQACLNTD